MTGLHPPGVPASEELAGVPPPNMLDAGREVCVLREFAAASSSVSSLLRGTLPMARRVSLSIALPSLAEADCGHGFQYRLWKH